MPRFAANISMMFTEWEFLDRFAAAADAGFRHVEFLFPYAYEADEIARRLVDSHLTAVLFNLPPGDFAKGERGLAALPHRDKDFRASVATALSYAKALDVKQLHVMSGVADARDPRANAAWLGSLRHAAETFAAEGIDTLIEPLNKRDNPGYFLADFRLATELIAELETPGLKLQYDVYHRQILHGDVLTSLSALMPLIGHVQIASVPDRHEPGTGELDDDLVLRRLDALGYSGYVGCEYRPAHATPAGLGWFDAWRKRMESGGGFKSMRGEPPDA